MTTAPGTQRPVLALADLEAFDPRPSGSGRERRYLCPLPACADKPRDRAHQSLSLNVETGAWCCHRCGASGVLRERWRPRRERVVAAARRAFAVAGPAARPSAPTPPTAAQEGQADAWREWYERGRPVASGPAAAYLTRRGVPPGLAARAGAVFVPDYYGRPAVVFPLRDAHGALVAVNGRYVDGRDRPKARSAGEAARGVFLADPEALAAARPVITEAPLDALSLAAAGVPAVALAGTTLPSWLPRALAFRRVALGFDADAAGDAAAERAAAALAPYSCRMERWRPAGAKDWNELLRLHGVEALAAAAFAAGCAWCGAQADRYGPDGTPACADHDDAG